MGGVSCDLQVDVNGEALFFVDKKLLLSFSGRLSKLFGESVSGGSTFKVIFYNFPGGAEIFELVARFCYNNGNTIISPTNLNFLCSAAYFMEMSKTVLGTDNLIEQTEKSLEEIAYWSWSDLLLALKQYQELPGNTISCDVVNKCVDTLVGRLALAAETSPSLSTSSPESFGFRVSCDSRSTESLKKSWSRGNWWFDDLLVLNENLIDFAVKFMMSRKFDHGTIGRFLLHYQKSKFVHSKSDEKRRIIEMVVNNLASLDPWSVSYKNLMGILRISLKLNLSKSLRCKLEAVIGSRMDEATLDNILVPSPVGVDYLYDMNLVLRLLQSFCNGGIAKASNDRIVRVVHLLDLYMAEVAPDPFLKSSKFLALATALPDSFRDSYDELYHAMNMYLEVHTNLSEEEIFKLCSALNYEKLSPEACIHLSKNTKFPSRFTVQTLLSQQTKLKSVLHDSSYSVSCSSSPYFSYTGNVKARKNESSDQIVLYAGKFDNVSEHNEIRAHLRGMEGRVTELEKVCQKMQSQVEKMMRTKSSSNMNAKSLPRLCS